MKSYAAWQKLEDTPEQERDHRATLIAYLLSAVARADWHAVSDAANDLRVLEAKAEHPWSPAQGSRP